jgi:hypothetical protein
MALVPRTGSNPAPVSQPDQQTPLDLANVLEQAPYIRNALVQRTSFNPDTFQDEFKSLLGYQEGARVNVTYFLRNAPPGDRRTDAMDISTVRNIIHQTYTCINNFEITLTDGIQMTYDQGATETNVTGEAIIYHGINPNIGDVLLLTLTDGKVAQCAVSSVEPMSIRQLRQHKITFFVTAFANDTDIQLLIDASTAITYFDKTTFMSGESTLLLADSYTQLLTLRQMRTVIAKYYFSNFYNQTAAAILAPDGRYDAYMNKFLSSKISFQDVKRRSLQHPIDEFLYNNTIWGRMVDIYDASITGLFGLFTVALDAKYYTDVTITSLLNRPMVTVVWDSTINPDGTWNVNNPTPDWHDPNQLTPAGTPVYVFSAAFYSGTVDTMSPLELVVYNAIINRSVTDVNGLINNYINTFRTLTKDQQYYMIPIYFFLIDLAIQTVQQNPASTTATTL